MFQIPRHVFFHPNNKASDLVQGIPQSHVNDAKVHRAFVRPRLSWRPPHAAIHVLHIHFFLNGSLEMRIEQFKKIVSMMPALTHSRNGFASVGVSVFRRFETSGGRGSVTYCSKSCQMEHHLNSNLKEWLFSWASNFGASKIHPSSIAYKYIRELSMFTK